MLESVYEYVLAARQLDEAGFLASCPDSVLLIEPFVRAADADRFSTIQDGETEAGRLTGTSVARLRKRLGSNAYPGMITIGRAPNNDIVIPEAKVSKLHAYVVIAVAGGEPMLV